MIKPTVFILTLIASFINLFGQTNPILVFNLESGLLDSMIAPPYDTSIQSSQTDYFIGNYNSNIATLDVEPPTSNLLPNTEFTIKKKVSDDYEISDFPFRTSVKLFSVRNDTLVDWCSGSMISSMHVLTAAHCVADFNTNDLIIDSLLVCPDYDNGKISPPFGCFFTKKIYFLKDWKPLKEDIAILELEEPIGEKTGWIGIGFNKDDMFFSQGIYYKFPYPAHPIFNWDSTAYNGDTLYYNYGKIDLVQENFLGVDDGFGMPGESGSSLILIENNQDYTSYGTFGYSQNLSHCRITNSIFYAFKEIIKDHLSSTNKSENETTELLLFPNPTTNYFRLKGKEKKLIENITIIDNWGRKQSSFYDILPNQVIDISGLENGTYWTIIQVEKMIFTKKLTKISSY